MAQNDATLSVWLARLSAAPDAQARQECLRALELLGHIGALPVLAEIFATDPDPDLRAQAQEAGKAIYYAAVRRAWEISASAEEDRQRAADALARAVAKKNEREV